MKPVHPLPLRRLLALLLSAAVLLTGLPACAEDLQADTDAPTLLLARSYAGGIDLGAYLASEKLDGVRAYWDGTRLRSRSGRTIHAPAWFTAPFPPQALDGELWMGRRSFDRLSAAVRRQQPLDAEWQMITYQLYELPDGAGDFSARVAALKAIAAHAGAPWLQVVPQERIAGKAALMRRLAQIVRDGGEGLMLHRADASWQTGRSDVLLKLKPQHDAEAVVVAHEPGQGKYRGMLGAIIVAAPEGRRFRLGTGFSDAQRRDPPPVGSTVTYRYRDLTPAGMPRFASFMRIRQSE
jgi:DNA ligase 1